MPDLPPRYESLSRLGAGGGGEVWSVRDRVSGQVLALKLLSSDAGENEVGALVREAIALSGLEGLGVPRVVAFGALHGGRRYMLRELVLGSSLEDVLENGSSPWLEAIATACDQLTVVHRAGLLHGDIKPANVIVSADGHGTLVDLGLAAPWREGGSTPQGLTPKYAAPELFQGQPLTVRAEVYSLGATLGEALRLRGAEVPADRREALARVAARASEVEMGARWPSVDELASALRRAAGLPPGAPSDTPPWPVLGLEATARALLERVRSMPAGGGIALEGPRGAGRSTLVRRLAWTLGVDGCAVAVIDAPKGGMPIGDVVELELAQRPSSGANGANGAGPKPGLAPVVIVDDAERIDEAGARALRKASENGARLVVVGPRSVVAKMVSGEQVAFVVPPLEAYASDDLVRRAVPSLPEALRAHLIERTGGRPGALRAAVRPPCGPGDRLEGRGRRGARRPGAPDRALGAPVPGRSGAGVRRGRADARHGPVRRRGARPGGSRRAARQRGAGAPGDGEGPDRDRPGRRRGGARGARRRRTAGARRAAPARLASAPGARVPARRRLRRGLDARQGGRPRRIAPTSSRPRR